MHACCIKKLLNLNPDQIKTVNETGLSGVMSTHAERRRAEGVARAPLCLFSESGERESPGKEGPWAYVLLQRRIKKI
jgi:hypothetical protein